VSPSAVSCNYPILVGQNPPFCNGHIDLVGNKETKVTSTRKRKLPGEGGEDNQQEKPKTEPRIKKPKEEKPIVTKMSDVVKRLQQPIKKHILPSEKMTSTPILASSQPSGSPYFPSMQSPMFLPHLLRNNVPSAVPMAQYLNPRIYENMRRVPTGDGKEGDDQHKINPMGRPDAFVPTFFYHPGLIFNQPIKMQPPIPPIQEHPPEPEKKAWNTFKCNKNVQ